MICPECNTEYLEGVKVCADCNVTLVDADPLDIPLKEIIWTRLGPVNGQVYAEMVAEVLTDKGIPHYIKSDMVESALLVSAANMVGSKVYIYVPEENKNKAKEILETILG